MRRSKKRTTTRYLIATRPRYMRARQAGDTPARLSLDRRVPQLEPDDGAATDRDSATTFDEMTTASDEQGCGYESQLEAIYRFLVDPTPYRADHHREVPAGTSRGLRRPDRQGHRTCSRSARRSCDPTPLVAIIMMTDENDCSIQESGQYYYAATPGHHVCRTARRCARRTRTTSAATPAARRRQLDARRTRPAPPGARTFAKQDPANLRCWDQKQRFGFDFLYPTARYVNALSKAAHLPRPNAGPEHDELPRAARRRIRSSPAPRRAIASLVLRRRHRRRAVAGPSGDAGSERQRHIRRTSSTSRRAAQMSSTTRRGRRSSATRTTRTDRCRPPTTLMVELNAATNRRRRSG